MREPNTEREFLGMNSINSMLNQHQTSPFHNFDPASSHEDFLQQMLSSVPSSAPFPWSDDHPPPGMDGNLDDQTKMRHQQINNGAAKAWMLQQQLLLSRGLSANEPLPHADQNDVVDAQSPNSANQTNDASIKALFNAFTGSLGQTSNQYQNFHQQGGALQQSQDFGGPAAPAMSQPAASGSTGGGAAGQPRQRVRAKRGQATDPHSIAERLRRERIAERMKSLQELVPNANKTDKASMLDEIIDYVKFLQLQVKVLSMSRLGGAGAVPPLVAHKSTEGRSSNGTQTASSSNNKEGLTVTELQVAKMMEEDMGSAMQYLQGKGLCLMPISLATAISATTSRSTHPRRNSEPTGPLSPSISGLTVQSATTAGKAAEKSP